MPERLYTIAKTKLLLGVHTRTIQKWNKAGKTRAMRTLGGRRRIPESKIHRLQGERSVRNILGYTRISSQTQKDDL